MARLRHDTKYFGTYTNSKKEIKDAYVLWDQDNADKGFMIRDRDTNKPIRNDRFNSLIEAVRAGFLANGKSEPVAQEQETVA